MNGTFSAYLPDSLNVLDYISYTWLNVWFVSIWTAFLDQAASIGSRFDQSLKWAMQSYDNIILWFDHGYLSLSSLFQSIYDASFSLYQQLTNAVISFSNYGIENMTVWIYDLYGGIISVFESFYMQTLDVMQWLIGYSEQIVYLLYNPFYQGIDYAIQYASNLGTHMILYVFYIFNGLSTGISPVFELGQLTRYFYHTYIQPLWLSSTIYVYESVQVYENDTIAHVCFVLMIVLLIAIVCVQYWPTNNNVLQMKQLTMIPNILPDADVTIDLTASSVVWSTPMNQIQTCSASAGMQQGQWFLLRNNGPYPLHVETGSTIAKATEKQSILQLLPNQSGFFIWMDPYWLTAVAGYKITNCFSTNSE